MSDGFSCSTCGRLLQIGEDVQCWECIAAQLIRQLAAAESKADAYRCAVLDLAAVIDYDEEPCEATVEIVQRLRLEVEP